MRKLGGLVLSVLMILMLELPAVAQRYGIVDLGTVQGDVYSEGGGVNILGHVAGCASTTTYSCSSNISSVGFLWTQQNGLQALPPLSSGVQSFAAAINDSDEMVGISWVPDGLYARAVLWTNSNTIQDLGTLPRGSNSEARGINNLGQVTGYSYGDFAGSYHAFLWTSSTGMRDLDPVGSRTSIGDGVNVKGHVCGELVLYPLVRAFLWTEQKSMLDLGVLPGWTWSGASALNDLDEVVGYSEKAINGGYVTHATLWTWSKGVRRLRDLGTLPGGVSSDAFAINNLGQVVGYSDFANSAGTYHAFVWSLGAGMQDLNSLIPAGSGWTLTWASGINDLGQITGRGTINQQTHAFLLTPTH